MSNQSIALAQPHTKSGRPSSLPSPYAPGPETVPSVLRSDGACADNGFVALFDDERRYDEAKAICASCTVREVCLAYALGNETSAVWGGTTPTERDAIREDVLIFGPEERRRASELRASLASGEIQEQIARDYAVSIRTLERWVAKDRHRSAA